MRKELGKISRAYFGTVSDYPFLLGIIFNFSLGGGGSGIGCGGKYTVNVSPDCKYAGTAERNQAIVDMCEKVASILEDAKVNRVSELKGVPVEVTIEGNCFRDFRILDEVL